MKKKPICPAFLLFAFLIVPLISFSQGNSKARLNKPDSVTQDTLSKFDKTNRKMEALFKIIPVPIYSYSTEAGHTIGFAKYNLINLNRNDIISAASRISEVVTFSTEGRVNISVSTDLNWKEGKYMVAGYINYRKLPEYMLGIGNEVSVDDLEEVSTTRLKFVNYGHVQVAKNLYAGIGLDLTNYTNIKYDSTSFLIQGDSVTGIKGTSTGLGLSVVYDTPEQPV